MYWKGSVSKAEIHLLCTGLTTPYNDLSTDFLNLFLIREQIRGHWTEVWNRECGVGVWQSSSDVAWYAHIE